MLRILLLGSPAVYLDDQPVRIKRRIQRWLLYYLASQNDLVGRLDIILLLWPDESETDGRRHLREALSKLRSQLPDDAYWITYHDRIGLNFQNVSVDLHDYQNLTAQAWRAAQDISNQVPLPDMAVQAMQDAVTLWRSPRFLAGANVPVSEELDRWWSTTAQVFENSRQRLMERLAYHAAASGNKETGIYWMRLALENDELNETFQLQILTWLKDLGRRREAIHYCNYLQDLYKRELGIALPPALQELFLVINSYEEELPQPEWPVWPSSLNLQLPFVGRVQALSELKKAYQRGGSVAISGEAGAGKSRLMHQLFISLAPRPRLLLAMAHASEHDLPFQPLIEMLRKNVRPEEWRKLDPVWAAPLAQLFPELSSIRSSALSTNQLEPDEARRGLFEALHQLLLMLAGSERILVCLDDAQWSDEATLAALAYVQERQFFHLHGLLILAARPEERSASLEEFFNRPHIQSMLIHLPLSQLSQNEISDLTRYALGQTPSAELSARLAHGTGGNPLLLIETLRAWLDHSPAPDLAQTVENLPLAGSIHTLLNERLRNFSSESRGVLATAAVIGHQFTPDILETATGMNPDHLVQILDDLEHANLIRPDNYPPLVASYVFIHDRFREVLLMELSPARLRRLHLKVARALEQNHPGQLSKQAAVLAGHYEAAGQSALAFRAWLEAAHYAQSLFSSKETYASYHRAEQILQIIQSELTDKEVFELYIGWGELAYDLWDVETMQQLFSALLKQGTQRSSSWLIGSAISGLARAAGLLMQFEQALQDIQEAIPYLEESGDLYQQIEAHIRKGSFLTQLNRYEKAISSYQEAIRLGQGSTDPHVIASEINAQEWLVYTFTLTGWPGKALELSEQILRERRKNFQSVSQVRTNIVYSQSLFYTGRYQQALEQSHSGLDVSERMGSTSYSAALHIIAARSELALGRLDSCWVHIARVLHLSESNHLDDAISEGLSLKGDFYRLLSCYPESVEAYHQALAIGGESFSRMQSFYRLGVALIASGKLDTGREMIEQSVEFSSRVGLGMILIPALMNRASVYIAEGDLQHAEQVLREVRGEAAARKMGMLPVLCASLSAKIHLANRKWEEALLEARNVVRLSANLPHPLLEVNGLLLTLEILRLQGSQPQGEVQRVRSLLHEMDARAHLPEVRPYFEHYQQSCLDQIQ